MKTSKILSTATFALSLSLVGLAAGVTTGCGGTAAQAEKGSDKKCGAGNCGAKKADEKGEEKGSDHKCGAGSCG